MSLASRDRTRLRAHSFFGIVALLGAMALTLACATPEVPQAFTDEAFVEAEYRIASADILQVRVWKNPELSVTAPVLPDGHLTVPLVGQVLVRDLTTSECEDLIAAELAEFVAAPEVSVIVEQVNGKRVSVIGEVTRPGAQALSLNMRIVDALSLSGGFTPFADQRRVRLIRTVEGAGEQQFRFDFKAYAAGKAPDTNVLLLPGDVVVVPD